MSVHHSISHERSNATLLVGKSASLHGFFTHTNFQAFFQPAVLALVSVVLIDGAVALRTACVRQIPPNASLEEAFAAFASVNAVVFAG